MGCVQSDAKPAEQSNTDNKNNNDTADHKHDSALANKNHKHEHNNGSKHEHSEHSTHFAENADADFKEHKKVASHLGIFSGMALKFPLVRKAFKNVQKAFRKHCDDPENISVKKLGDLLHSLGAKNLNEQEIQKLFKMADLDHSKSISFREFLIAIAVGYYLTDNVAASQRGPDFEETQKGFRVIETFFKKIDKDNGGSVDPQELKNALFEASSSEQSNEILEARFKELDFNGDGDIEFPEFLYGFTKWVMGDDDEDEDDEAEDRLTEQNTMQNNHAE